MKLIAAGFACLTLLISSASAEPVKLAWDKLIDSTVQAYEDPFRDLDYKDIKRLADIVRLRDGLKNMPEGALTRAETTAEIETLREELARRGLDADWLISQRWVVAERRERAAKAGSPDVDGQEIIIAGFAILAPADQDGTSVAYLVPKRGMCSHTPPPPPNQMIRARLPEGWVPSWIHEPVRLTGRLSIAPSEQIMRVVDGMVPMRATFQLDVERVETVSDLRLSGRQAGTKTLAEELARRVRAASPPPRE